MVAAVPVMRLVLWLDTRTQWRGFGFSVEGAQAILGGLSSSMLTFIVFAVSGLLLAVQIASGQLTPRIISLVFARPVLRVSVGIFVFAYTFTLSALGRIETVRVPELLVMVAVLLTLVSIAVFFWFVQQLGTGLRPVFILSRSGRRRARPSDACFRTCWMPAAARGPPPRSPAATAPPGPSPHP